MSASPSLLVELRYERTYRWRMREDRFVSAVFDDAEDVFLVFVAAFELEAARHGLRSKVQLLVPAVAGSAPARGDGLVTLPPPDSCVMSTMGMLGALKKRRAAVVRRPSRQVSVAPPLLELVMSLDTLHHAISSDTQHGTWLKLSRVGQELKMVVDGPAGHPELDEVFRRLLATAEAMVDEPDCSVDRLSPVSRFRAEERVLAWARGPESAADSRPIHEQVEDRALRAPDAIAFDDGRCVRSNAWLNDAAAKLGTRLICCGARPEMLVGIHVADPATMVISVLAVLKTGAAFVPLDPNYPPARLEDMVRRAGIRTIVTDSIGPVVPHPCDLVRVVEGAPTANEAPCEKVPVDTDNLAYVIFTSGSTGKPKGVMVSHRGIGNLARVWAHRMGVTEQSRAVVYASPSFDSYVVELFQGLLAGATLVLRPRRGPLLGSELAAFLAESRATWVPLPPSALASLPMVDLPALRGITVAGEACPTSLAQRWGAERHFVNAYGPTEATVCVTTEVSSDTRRIGIGTPFDNTLVYLLDDRLAPVPLGQVGQIYLGGPNLARGYVGMPAETAERFVPDAISGRVGARLYQTGDLARYAPDGRLDFLGRRDNQVKIRGYRVEIEEIEAALCSHADVELAAVVAAREDGEDGDEVSLGAVVQLAPGRTSSMSELNRFLRGSLPDYMLPRRYAFVQTMPVTPIGKIDRSLLPGLLHGSGGMNGEATDSSVESSVAAVFAQVLKVPSVGLDESFFDLGGHSLLAIQAVVRLGAHLGIELPLAEIFNHPTPRALAVHVRKLLGEPAPPEPAAERPTMPGSQPELSSAEERFWLADRLAGDATYSVPLTFLLDGEIDVPVMEQSVRYVAERHDPLLTRYPSRDGTPVPQVLSSSALVIRRIDLRSREGTPTIAEARTLAADEAQRRFEIDREAPIRLVLITISASQHLLLLNLHHIVADEWGLGLLWDELASTYEALRASRVPTLPAIRLTYRDYARRERTWLRSSEAGRQLAFWEHCLEGVPASLTFTASGGDPTLRAGAGALFRLRTSAEVTQAINGLGRSLGASSYMICLATWKALLCVRTGVDDIVVGSVVANRSSLEAQALFGVFVNTVALRTQLSGAASFREVVSRVRTTALDAFSNQGLPFETVLQRRRQTQAKGLFGTLLRYSAEPLEPRRLDVLQVTLLEGDTRTAKFPLSWSIVQRGPHHDLEIEYDLSLYDETAVTKLASDFTELLLRAATEPDATIRSLVPAADREAEDLDVLALFDRQVGRTPHKIAVSCGAESLTYAELARLAQSIATSVADLIEGASGEVVIPLLMARSPVLLASMIGVMRAGAAYLPLTTNDPDSRLATLVREVSAGPTIVDGAQAERATRLGLKPLIVDNLDRAPTRWRPGRPAPHPQSLAYVLYTSGSTGRPKGVAITHQSLAQLCRWTRETYSDEELSGVLASTPAGFDVSVFETLAVLACGGCVVLVENFFRLKATHTNVTLVSSVPSVIRQFLQSSALPPSVAVVNVGGEVVPPTLVDAIYRAPNVRKVYNVYGPTEDTTYSTFHLVGRGEVDPLPLGSPIAGTFARIVDSRTHILEEEGELYLAGDGLARGYWARPDLTADRFRPDPWARDPGSRMYRTGDAVKRAKDGGLLFQGRLDSQLKIGGQRIELEEIEATLVAIPGVTAGAIAVRSHRGQPKLVAYVVVRSPQVSDATILDALTKRLPPYMVPDRIVHLPELPLSPNGKVDRGALPEPSWPRATDRVVAPGLEQELSAMWCSLLNVDQIGPDDDFFELGGSSLLAVALAMRIEKRFGIQFPPQLRTAGRINGISVRSTVCAIREARQGVTRVAAILSEGDGQPFFLVHALAGGVSCYRHLIRSVQSQVSLVGLDAPGLYRSEDAPINLGDLASFHFRTIRDAQPSGPVNLLGWSFGAALALEIVRCVEREHGEVGRVVLIDPPLHGDFLPRHVALSYALRRVIYDLGRENEGRGFATADLVQQLSSSASDEDVSRALASIPYPEEREATRRLAVLYRTHLQAFADMVPKRPVAAPLVVWQTTDAMSRGDRDALRELSPAVEVHFVGADHDAVLRRPFIDEIANDLRSFVKLKEKDRHVNE